MLKNWLIILLRFGSRNKLSFTLNFVGLIIGLACSFSLLNYILYEYGYDQMHINKKNIFV
jgi:putative ABC transport system permease protein